MIRRIDSIEFGNTPSILKLTIFLLGTFQTYSPISLLQHTQCAKFHEEKEGLFLTFEYVEIS